MRYVDTIGASVQRATRFLNQAQSISTEEAKDPEKVAASINAGLVRVSQLEARVPPEAVEFQVACGTSGSTHVLEHGFDCPVRWYVTYWKKQESGIDPVHSFAKAVSVVAYGFTVGVWSVGTPSNISVGSSWRQTSRREILGVRFIWAGGATTVRARIWNNTTGLSLASKDIAVTAVNGVYEAMFSSPITTDLTGTDITASVWDTTATVYTFNNDVRLVPPIWIGPDLKLVNFLNTPAAGGDTRPATVAAGGHFMVEPILGNYAACPELAVDTANTTSKRLVLKSYGTGSAVVRVEPSQQAVMH